MRREGLLNKLHRKLLRRRRRTRLYCVGTGKSGTHSIAAMFADHLRSGHEPEAARTKQLIIAAGEGQVSQEEFRRSILERDRRLRLEVDSSFLNYHLLDALLALFPDARFLLTIRHPVSWLDSHISHWLARPVTRAPGIRFREFRRVHDFRFSPSEASHPPEEAVLQSRGLYTLDSFFSYWARHNRTVVERVPAERLLVVRTDQITDRAADIARFAGVPPAFANAQKSHDFRAKTKFNLLSQLDAGYLDAKVRQHCGELMDRFFGDASPPREYPGDGQRLAAGGLPVAEAGER